jgi:hypothetical protein
LRINEGRETRKEHIVAEEDYKKGAGGGEA